MNDAAQALISFNSFISYSRHDAPPIRIALVRSHTGPDGTAHESRASAQVNGRSYDSEGPAPIYRLSTLLYLDGYRGLPFEVHDDRSPTGGPGGLSMRGTVRNWARKAGAKMAFDAKAKPDMEFTPDQEAGIRALAGGADALCASRRARYPRVPGTDKATGGRVHGVGAYA